MKLLFVFKSSRVLDQEMAQARARLKVGLVGLLNGTIKCGQPFGVPVGN